MSEGIRDYNRFGGGERRKEGRKTQVLEETELHGSTQTSQELTVKH